MPIPEDQLETWSHQGSVTQSKDSYATVRRCLESSAAPFADKVTEIFLQGSYANATNVYAESDVDIVIKLNSTYYYDISELTVEEQEAFHRDTGGSAEYAWGDFRQDVLSTLRDRFGQDVAPGTKAVAISASGSRRKADVLVSAQFRQYVSYSPNPRYHEGVCFFTGSGRVSNFPRQHRENLSRKHQATGSWFKPIVRVFKNIRRSMVSDGVISGGLAPSYFLEGLLYNVPPEKFGGSYQASIVSALNWILGAERTEFVGANELYYLLREESDVCWSPASCDAFLTALVDYWEKW